MFPVIEKFVSIDGEGPMAGALATFIRFEGCNLRCKWCDTTYSWEAGAEREMMSSQAIYAYIKEMGVKHITLTGGEPLMQPEMGSLLAQLINDPELLIHIETNGSVDIEPFKKAYPSSRIRYIVDFKLPASGMTHKMALNNLNVVEAQDVYKFVIASEEDIKKAYSLLKSYALDQKCQVYWSPVVDTMSPARLVEFMKQNQLGDIKLQLQLHKIIWPKESRGV